MFVSSSLIVLFICGYLIVKSGKIPQTQIIKWSVIFSVLTAFAIPSHSSDLYGYIARGAQQSLYQQNPYFETVSEINSYKSNPLFLNFMWPSQQTTYGPFFIFITKAIVFLSHNNFFLSFINFKLMNLTLFFLLLFFVLKIGDEKNVYLIAWNPLLLVQGLWNCHNDFFSGILIFCGVYMLVKKNYFWGVFLFVISAAVKYVSLIIFPLVLFKIIKNNPQLKVFLNIILGIISGILLVLIFSTDYLVSVNKFSHEDFQTIFSNINLVHKSFISTLFSLIKHCCRLSGSECNYSFILGALKAIFYSTFLLFYIFVLVKADKVVHNIALILFVFFAFVIAKFHSWYLLNVIVLLPFLEESKLKKILIALSLSHVYALTFIDQAKILNFTFMTFLPVLYIYFKSGSKS